MATSSSAVPREVIQHRAYELWEKAGFPPHQSLNFWLMAEQQCLPSPLPPAAVPLVQNPSAAAPAAEEAPVHPARKPPAAKRATAPRSTAPSPPARKSSVKNSTPPPPAAAAKPKKPKAGDSS